MPKNAVTWILMLGFGLLAACTATAGDDLQLIGPFTNQNLTVYLVRGKPAAKMKLLPLQQAMADNKVMVYETGNVNQLSIENRSNEDVYVQSGDIVKGGQQDRVLTTDFVLPAHSGKLPVSSFCVEQGRWSKRGAEPVANFNASNLSVPSKDLKMAVKSNAPQSQVWSYVAESRAKLASGATGLSGVAGGVAAARPAAPPPPPAAADARAVPASTSMQMAMESKPVVDRTETYMKALAKIVDEHKDASGYVYLINGKLNSAEVYSSPELFRQMWPKLLRASATEALAEQPQAKSAPPAPPSTATVKAMLVEADQGKQASKQAAGQSIVTRKESAKVVLFETHDPKTGGDWIHRSYVVK
jgi:hypothetical protein